MVEMADLRKRPNDSGEDALLVPSGTPVYESLSAKLIDFERLQRTLGQGGYSGFVRILGVGLNAIILFRNGKLIDALWRDKEELRQGEPALSRVAGLLQSGEAVIDVVDLQPELVDSLHHLASGAPTYPEMYASWVNVEGLIAFLRERHFTGTVSIRSREGGGVLMLRQGELGGAFTTNSRELAGSQDEVLALCSDPEARIEVRSALGQPPPARHREPAPPEEREAQPAGASEARS